MEIKEQMLELYNQGLSNTQIAEKVNRSVSAVSLMLKRCGIKNNHQRKYKHSEFIKLYEQGLNNSEIGRRLNVSSNAISNYVIKLGLKPNFKNDRVLLTQEHKFMLVGTLLGDSYLQAYKETASGMFAHSLAQEKYFLYKKDFLKDITNKTMFKSQFRNEVENFSIYTHFKSMRELYPIHQAFYTEEGKTLPGKTFIEENFNELSFAIWYGDDGGRFNTRHGKPCGKYLSTNSFSYENQLFLQRLLKSKLNIETTIYGKVINKYILYIPAAETPKVDKILKKYLTGLLDYKI
jgi:DNA-binding CsgD family transcriptional regulator